VALLAVGLLAFRHSSTTPNQPGRQLPTTTAPQPTALRSDPDTAAALTTFRNLVETTLTGGQIPAVQYVKTTLGPADQVLGEAAPTEATADEKVFLLESRGSFVLHASRTSPGGSALIAVVDPDHPLAGGVEELLVQPKAVDLSGLGTVQSASG
jgi:hypothetical protein